LVDGHQTLDSEYRRGLLAVSAAGRSFTQLSNQVAADIQRLPNPTERLESLWTGVEGLDERLRKSLGGASERLDTLATQTQATSASVERLAQSLRAASSQIERGGSEVSDTLQRELRDLGKVLDDFVALLERRIETAGVA
jgi:outer membrane murein-binding lipoprotein Lpp